MSTLNTLESKEPNSYSFLSSLGMLLLFVFLIWQVATWTKHYELNLLEVQANNELTLNIASLRGKLDKYEFLPEILVNKQNFADILREPLADNIQKLNATLKNFKQITDVSDIYLLDRTGTTLAASNWQSPRSFIGQNFNYRPYFKDAIQGQLGRFYGLGTTSGERGYYFSYPVFSGQTPIGVLVVKIVVEITAARTKAVRTEIGVGHIRQIQTRAKAAPFAGQNNRAYRLVFGQLLTNSCDGLKHGHTERIHFLGTVQTNIGNMIFYLYSNQLGHRAPLMHWVIQYGLGGTLSIRNVYYRVAS